MYVHNLRVRTVRMSKLPNSEKDSGTIRTPSNIKYANASLQYFFSPDHQVLMHVFKRSKIQAYIDYWRQIRARPAKGSS